MDAVRELKQAGKDGAEVAPKLQRLLSSKTKSQYQTTSVARREAELSIGRAKSLLEVAQRVVAS